MELNIDPDWLLQMAEKEDNGIVSVGGFFTRDRAPSEAVKLIISLLEIVQRRRLSWDEYFLGKAAWAALRSTCISQQVGAVIVKDKQVLATGYNGTPSGHPHCSEIGHCVNGEAECKGSIVTSPAIHAEFNAIAQAARNGTAIGGASLYCTHPPCQNCSKLITAAGIERVITPELLRGE